MVYGKCGVLHFGGSNLRNGASYVLEIIKRIIPVMEMIYYDIVLIYEIAFGEIDGTICGLLSLPEVPEIALEIRRIRTSVSRPTARMSHYLSIC